LVICGGLNQKFVKFCEPPLKSALKDFNPLPLQVSSAQVKLTTIGLVQWH